MAHDGGTGVKIQLEAVPLREHDMIPYEIMLSESQERMLFAVNPSRLNEVIDILNKYELGYAIIGEVTNTKRVQVYKGNKLVADLPTHLLADPPVIMRPQEIPSYFKDIQHQSEPKITHTLSQSLLSLLNHPTIASKRWVIRQYDHEVGVQSIGKPGFHDAAVLHIHNTPHNIAFKSDSNSLHCYSNPFRGTAGLVAESARNIAAVGATPLALVNCLNFGNPQKPGIFWQFSEAVNGLREACKELQIPVVGGNVSFYNEDEETGQAIKPNPVIMVLGKSDFKIPIPSLAVTQPNYDIWIVGTTYSELGGSLYYFKEYGSLAGTVPLVRYDKEKALHEFTRKIISEEIADSIHDVSQGGIAVALAEMSITGGIGINVNCTQANTEHLSPAHYLFSESHGRMLFAIPSNNQTRFEKHCKALKVSAHKIGKSQSSPQLTITIDSKKVSLSLTQLRETYSDRISKIMEAHPENE
jgi:phosphoribosylformylglycinamidine synthase